jgi:predicted TIM-barrel fold metal-dependent hydrolase
MTDLLVVDADGHVCEPPDLWTTNLPPSLRDEGISLKWNADSGWDECWAEGRILVNRGLPGLGNAGLSFENFGQGMHYEDLNPAGFRPDERIKVLDAEGIHISVLYPGLGLKLGGIRDPQLAVESCKVYNDWIADYAGAAPTRLAGVGALPLQDPEEAVREVFRIKELGLVGGFCRPNPYGGESLHSPVFDRVWSALEEADLPLAFHPAGVSDMDGTALRMSELMAPGTQHAVILLFDQYMTLSNLVYAGVLERHPDLKVAVLECGGGWIGHWMDRLNEFHDSYKWAAAPLSMLPSEYFQRQCVVSFDPGEHTHKLLADFAGEHTFIWASDFPHNDAKYPGVVDELLEHSEGMTATARAGLVGTNALKLYGIESMAGAAAR